MLVKGDGKKRDGEVGYLGGEKYIMRDVVVLEMGMVGGINGLVR